MAATRHTNNTPLNSNNEGKIVFFRLQNLPYSKEAPVLGVVVTAALLLFLYHPCSYLLSGYIVYHIGINQNGVTNASKLESVFEHTLSRLFPV